MMVEAMLDVVEVMVEEVEGIEMKLLERSVHLVPSEVSRLN